MDMMKCNKSSMLLHKFHPKPAPVWSRKKAQRSKSHDPHSVRKVRVSMQASPPTKISNVEMTRMSSARKHGQRAEVTLGPSQFMPSIKSARILNYNHSVVETKHILSTNWLVEESLFQKYNLPKQMNPLSESRDLRKTANFGQVRETRMTEHKMSITPSQESKLCSPTRLSFVSEDTR